MKNQSSQATSVTSMSDKSVLLDTSAGEIAVPADEHPPGDTDQTPTVDYSQSGDLAHRLAKLDCSVAISSYQSGFLYNLGRDLSDVSA